MSWQPILAEPDDAYERSPKRDAEGRIYWVCHTGKHRGIRSHNVPGRCSCPEGPAMVCKHRLAVVAKIGCCGSPITRILGCEVFGACTLEANDGTLEWNGKAVASCDGCDKRSV